MDNYHVTKDGDKWKFKKQGGSKATKVADTKEEVINEMRDYMKDKVGSVKIHKVDGGIQEERTYQRKDDPKNTKG